MTEAAVVRDLRAFGQQFAAGGHADVYVDAGPLLRISGGGLHHAERIQEQQGQEQQEKATSTGHDRLRSVMVGD
jgi:hypothetical protein